MDTAVFDVGGVLLEWDPRHLYRTLFGGDEEAMEEFLATVCTLEWNAELDRGTPFDAAAAPLLERYPEHAAPIRAYRDRWAEMIPSEIPGTAAVVRRLRASGVRLYGLTNFRPDTFPLARERFECLRLFDGFVVSGEEGVTKPDPRLYRILCGRFDVVPERAVFVDDVEANVRAAEALGFRGIRFTGAEALERELRAVGLLER